MVLRLCGGDTEALIETLRESGEYDEAMYNRLRSVLLAPHKHKGRVARKTKEIGTNIIIVIIIYIIISR